MPGEGSGKPETTLRPQHTQSKLRGGTVPESRLLEERKGCFLLFSVSLEEWLLSRTFPTFSPFMTLMPSSVSTRCISEFQSLVRLEEPCNLRRELFSKAGDHFWALTLRNSRDLRFLSIEKCKSFVGSCREECS